MDCTTTPSRRATGTQERPVPLPTATTASAVQRGRIQTSRQPPGWPMRIATTLMVTALQLASVSMAAETLEGRVVSCDGYPLPYVSVALSTGETAITDAEGRFTFQVSPTSDLKISAGMNGLGEAVDHTCVAAGRSTRIDVILPLHVYDDCIPIGRNKLPESRRFDGTVTDIRFQPLFGATVRFRAIVPRLPPVSAATDRR